MRSFGSLPLYLLQLAICAGLSIAGVQIVFAPQSDNRIAGLMLLLLAAGLWRFAQKARADYLYYQKIGELADWAQRLGPDHQEGRRK